MPYVSRGSDGKVNGRFALPQPGLAEEFLAPDAPELNPPPDLKAAAATARFAKESGGITVGGAPVATDRGSQAMLTGAYNSATRDANWSTVWKTSSGAFLSLNSAQIIGIAVAVSSHVEACFAKEAQVAVAIDAGTVTTVQQVTDAFAAIPTAY